MQPVRPTDRHPPGSHRNVASKAMADLLFIRKTMERSQAFTAVPGTGGIIVGCTALIASFVASQQTDSASWILVWISEALLAGLIVTLSLFHKAKSHGISLSSGPGRRFISGLGPASISGVVLTTLLYSSGEFQLIPATWLLLYGAAVVSAGMFSVKVVPLMGSCFMAVGMLAAGDS